MQKRMRRKSGRWISLLLSVVLVCSMLPVNSFAEEGGSLSDEEPSMELSGIEEEKESVLSTEDDLILLEEDVQTVDDGEEAPSSVESTVEVAVPEEDLTATEEEITETNTEMVEGLFDSPQFAEVSVFFDPDDDTYTDFYKATVPVGGKITHKPADPIRDGYLFKGWYSALDQNNEPIMWDFENDTVMTNMSLWASWEEACFVAFAFNDGISPDYYNVTVPMGGKIIPKPADPTRDGYLFKGWYSALDQNNEPIMWDFENDTVMTNMSLWASWEEACFVAFAFNDGISPDYYNVTVPMGGKIIPKPADPTRDGYLFKGWYSALDQNYEPIMWDFENDTVTTNMSLWASWEEACFVAFAFNDGISPDYYNVTVPMGGKIIPKPADPTRDGYLFKGWYSGLDQNYEPIMWDFENDTVTTNMSLWASWEEACFVAFAFNDGISPDYYNVTVPMGGKIIPKPADPTRDGYLFKGWYSGLDQNYEPIMWDFENDTVTTNMSLWASWEEACFVAFAFNDGISPDYYNVTVPMGGKIIPKPADPTRDGYLFKGWYSGLDQNYEPIMWDFENDTVTTNMSLWASWEEACFVAFAFNDGISPDYYNVTVPMGGKIIPKPADPTRDGYLFKGWYSGLDQNYEPIMWDFENDTVMTNMSLWASWKEACFVAFDLNNGTSTEYYNLTMPVGEKIIHKPADPTREGYLFKGWYSYLDQNNEPVLWDFENDTVMTNMSLWASWKEACFVAFDLNNGTSTEYYNLTMPVGEKIIHKPADPTREGYLFKGWYSYLDQNNEPVLWDFENDTVMTNMSLWASWEEENSGGINNGGNSESGNNGGGESGNNGSGESGNNGSGESGNNGTGESGNNGSGESGNNGTGESGNNGSNGSNSSSGSNSSKNGPTVSGRTDDKGIVIINEQEVPKAEAPIFPGNSESVNIDDQAVPKGSLDNLPKTGEDNTSRILYSAMVLVSLFMIGTCLPYKKKNI